ncbi:unnamed protein product [Amoebophrya sp. A25]|nr:unnamed protein product [Amoebophrya sp. A25]|eukprot:GSA25T00006319001.1
MTGGSGTRIGSDLFSIRWISVEIRGVFQFLPTVISMQSFQLRELRKQKYDGVILCSKKGQSSLWCLTNNSGSIHRSSHHCIIDEVDPHEMSRDRETTQPNELCAVTRLVIN